MNPTPGLSHVCRGADLTPEEAAFGQALDHYKRHAQRPYPTYSEVLAVLRALGYRRVQPPAAEYRRFVREGAGGEVSHGDK